MKRREFLLAGTGLAGAVVGSRWSGSQALAAAFADAPIDMGFLFEPGPDELSLVTTGDAILYRGHDELSGPGFDELFQMQRSTDLAITNCEVVFSEKGYPKPKDIARARPEVADGFVWQGIDMVSLANNHSMDLGPDALLETIQVLEKRNIVYAGGGKDLAAANRPGVVTRKGIRVGLLSYACMASPVVSDSAAKKDRPGLAGIRGFPVRVPEEDGTFRRIVAPDDASLKGMEDAVRSARSQVDVLLMAYHMHWGRRSEVDEGRKIIAHAAIDNGVDLVFAHGPHVINPVERYKGKYIFYSLGNFFFHIFKGNAPADSFGPNWPIRNRIFNFTTTTDFWEGLAPRVIIGKDGVRKVQVLPIALTRDGNPRFPEPQLGAAIIEDFQAMSEGMGADFEVGEWHADLAV